MALDLSNVKKASSFKEQFTVRAMVIGTIGSIILTASSMFVALKASSLPWPIMFVTLFSMCLLKIMGNTNVNEINVTHTAMSAGSMVAGGLGVSVLSAFSLAGYEGQVRVIPLTQPVSRRLGVAVKTPPPANSAARYFLSFLKRQYPAEPADNE